MSENDKIEFKNRSIKIDINANEATRISQLASILPRLMLLVLQEPVYLFSSYGQ